MKIGLVVLLVVVMQVVAESRRRRGTRRLKKKGGLPCEGTCKDEKEACKCTYKCDSSLTQHSLQSAYMPIDKMDLKNNVQLQNIEKEEAKITDSGDLAVTYYFIKPDPEACASLGEASVTVEGGDNNRKLKMRRRHGKYKRRHRK